LRLARAQILLHLKNIVSAVGDPSANCFHVLAVSASLRHTCVQFGLHGLLAAWQTRPQQRASAWNVSLALHVSAGRRMCFRLVLFLLRNMGSVTLPGS
jgi:hypothetical protein